MFSYTGICAILIVVLQTLVLEDNSKSYDAFFYFNGGMSIVALLILVTVFKEDKFID